MKKIYVVLLIVIIIILVIINQKHDFKNNDIEINNNNLDVINIEIKKNDNEDADYLKINDVLKFKVTFSDCPNQNVYIFINNQNIKYTISNNNIIIFDYHVLDNNKLVLSILYMDKNIFSYDLPNIDDESPKCVLEKDKSSLKIFGSDNVGITGYAITKNDKYEFSMNNEIEYDSIGIWYGYIKDYAGNIGMCQINIPDEYTVNPYEITVVGDSRMVGMCSYNWYKNEGGTCVAKVSAGYRWFLNEAINEVNSVPLNKKKYIVVNLGVNDLYSIKSYISKYQLLSNNEWKNSTIFLLSVNPTDGKESYLNNEIDMFNQNLKNAFIGFSNVSYCDSSNYLKQNGFQTRDGVHYQEGTYKIIYERIKKCLYDYYNN